MDAGRGRRERAPKRGAAALAELAALRKGTGGGGDGDAAPKKRLDAFELKDEGAVYDVVDEDEYAALVAKRRREGGEFRCGGVGARAWGGSAWSAGETKTAAACLKGGPRMARLARARTAHLLMPMVNSTCWPPVGWRDRRGNWTPTLSPPSHCGELFEFTLSLPPAKTQK